MFFARCRLRTIAVAVMMLCATSAYADLNHAAAENGVQYSKQPELAANLQNEQSMPKHETAAKAGKKVEPDLEKAVNDWQAKRAQNLKIAMRSSQIFSLLGAEIALNKGEPGTALATYMTVLERTKSPKTAERALELAISLNAVPLAEKIFHKWQQIEPVPGEAQKRMIWLRDVAFGKAEDLNGLSEVLANTEEEQRRKIFLMLLQVAERSPDFARQSVKQVRNAAEQYPNMPEAVIADAFYSMKTDQNRRALKTLQHLAELKTTEAEEISVQAALVLMEQENPELMQQFFEQADTEKFSAVWQDAEIISLLQAGRKNMAYKRLQNLLAKHPSVDRYRLASFLSLENGASKEVFDNYLEKAYQLGTEEEKSQTAAIAAIRYADQNNFQTAEKWINRIKSPKYAFDKAVLKAAFAMSQNDSKTALAEVKRAQKMPEKSGMMFAEYDLQRIYLNALSRQEPAKALSELNKLLAKAEKQPDTEVVVSDIVYLRGMVYELSGRYREAVADLRRYVELNPNTAAGLNALGYTLLISPEHENSLEEAFKLIQAAYQLKPDSAAINDSMGWAYYLKGDAQAALPYVQYAHREGKSPEIAAHLGEILWALGEQKQAQQIWEEGWRKDGDKTILKKTVQKFKIQPAKAKKRSIMPSEKHITIQ